jgi:hypothetical protein
MRPGDSPGHYPALSSLQREVADMRRQLAELCRRLEAICRVVYPAPESLAAYGDEIRELLILACTEVEAAWRAILRANGASQDRLTTRDYVALQPAMRLSEYAVSFPHFPELAPVSPFEGWRATSAPTQDLDWYDAYNAVKHGREENFARATLKNALGAVSASVVMVCAQVGSEAALRQGPAESFVRLVASPQWPHTEVYTWIYRDHDEMMMAVSRPPPDPIGLVPISYAF